MDNLIGRYRNVTLLVAILFAQVLGLAVQVKRNSENESSRLIRIWTVGAITPLEKGIVHLQAGSTGLWRNYLFLRGVRQENRELKAQIEQLRLEQVRLKEDAEQARRLQLLLGFKEQFISKTMPAQVIGSSGSEQSRSVYIDKGSRDALEKDMPVISADGVVGKVLRVFSSTSQVLLINDQTSGVGTILEQSRLQGVLRGSPAGEVMLEKIMNDEQVQIGERVLTSGGDQIFPKGLLVGTVSKSGRGKESFLDIHIKPSANLSRLEEVLVITRKEEKSPNTAVVPVRALDILTQRLPSVPDKPAVAPAKSQPTTSSPATATTNASADVKVKAPATAGSQVKPASSTGQAVKPFIVQTSTSGQVAKTVPAVQKTDPTTKKNSPQETPAKPLQAKPDLEPRSSTEKPQ
ncbi:MAG: rod shape-determining protein MreC [Acidobacteriota bacterium]|nr:rod shape-determining protein MreC [Acidobacteriota bacterium]